MPKKLHGKRLTAKEHRQWKKVFKKTGKGGIATSAVKKSRARKRSKRR